MQKLCAIWVLILLASFQQAISQIETIVTIGAVKSAIEDSLNRIQSITVTAGGEVKGAGNQLQANAQNVLKDIDRIFKENLTLTQEKMDNQQQLLFRDAQSLAKMLRSISLDTLSKGGEEARRSLFEADILAYNTSYNLPCRSQNARLVYVFPDRIRIGKDAPEITIRGNYLSFGSNVELKVNEIIHKPTSRNQGEIHFRIDDNVLSSIKSEIAVPVELKTDNISRSLFLGIRCTEEEQTGRWQASVITLLPPRLVDIKAKITPSAKFWENRLQTYAFDSGKPGDCGINQDVSKQICSLDGWTVSSFSLSDVSVNGGCGSTAGPASASGSSCVHIPGRVVGCGTSAFGLNCKGRGWVSWKLSVTENKNIRKDADSQEFEIHDSQDESFTFKYNGADKLDAPQWTYVASIKIMEGEKVRSYELSNASNSVGPVSGRLSSDLLSIVIE